MGGLLTENQKYGNIGGMKTTLELPDDLMREIKILAAKEGRKMKDIITESLSRDLKLSRKVAGSSVRDIAPVSIGKVLDDADKEDRLESLLDDRGHRY